MPCLCICHIAWCLHWPKTSALKWGWHQEAAAPFHNIAAKILNHINTFNILNFWIWINVLTVCFVCSPNATIICYVFTQRQVSINSQLQVWVWVFAVLIFKTLCLFFETKIKATETTDMYLFLQMFFWGWVRVYIVTQPHSEEWNLTLFCCFDDTPTPIGLHTVKH